MKRAGVVCRGLLAIAASLFAVSSGAAPFDLVGFLTGGEKAKKPAATKPVATNVVKTSVVKTNVVKNVVTQIASTNETPKPLTAVADPAPSPVLPPPPRASRPPVIRSAKTFYDRKGGFAVFSGSVSVDDEDYQMHADKAYVFFEGTNQLKRLVATGAVAITNGTKRAYGEKVSYYHGQGMLVLHGGDDKPAEVRDEAKSENQSLKGRVIRFWTHTEQVEVVEADITAPKSSAASLKLPKRK